MNLSRGYDERLVTMEAVPFIKEKLEKGGMTFARLLRDKLNLETGRAIVLTKAGIDPLKTIDFEYGDGPGSPAESWLVWRARGFLRSKKNGVLICENRLWKPTYPWTVDSHYRLAFFHDELYNVAFSGDPNTLIRQAIQTSNSLWIHIGVMTSANPLVAEMAKQGELTEKGLAELAECTQCLFLGIYDGEGFLLWMTA